MFKLTLPQNILEKEHGKKEYEQISKKIRIGLNFQGQGLKKETIDQPEK